jgi:hypothetical protein
MEYYVPNSKYESEHFIIYYSPEYYSLEKIKILTENTEEVLKKEVILQDVEEKFKKTSNFKVPFYIYPSAKIFRQKFSSIYLGFNTGHEIYMCIPPKFINKNIILNYLNFGHEIGFIVMRNFWPPPNTICAPSMEAINTYFDARIRSPGEEKVLDYLSKEKLEDGTLNDLISTMQFFKKDSFAGYNTTNYEEYKKYTFYIFYFGSFVGFLVQNYGIDKLKEIVEIGDSKANVETIFGKSQRELFNNWKSYLLSLPKPTNTVEKKLEEYKRRLSNPIWSPIFWSNIKHYFTFKDEIADAYLSPNKNLKAKRLFIEYSIFCRAKGYAFSNTYSSWYLNLDKGLSPPTRFFSNIIFYPFYFFCYCPYKWLLSIFLLVIIILLVIRRNITEKIKGDKT